MVQVPPSSTTSGTKDERDGEILEELVSKFTSDRSNHSVERVGRVNE
jgi:hypothetical protein